MAYRDLADGADGWRPLLCGEAAERVRETVEQIAEELRANLCLGGMFQPAFFSLLDGYAGISLFFSYLHLVTSRKDDLDFAIELLERALDGVTETVAMPGLYAGFSGVGWVVEHLRDRFVDRHLGYGRELAQELDEELLGTDWQRTFNLLHGVTGVGTYGLERLPREGAQEWLAAAVGELARTADRSRAGIAWRARPGSAFSACELGVARGQAGVIGFLAAACATGAVPEETRLLVRRAVAWLLAQKLPPGERSAFPDTVNPLAPAQPSRLGWCSGDLGIAVTLLAAARHLRHSAWEREALALARHAAARRDELADTPDACLCHGTAGIAHLFNRLFQATGETVFADAARFWIERTFAIRRPGVQVAGFPFWSPDVRGEPGWRAEPGFLYGVAGVGLALLAAISPVEPAWDRVMLISVPRKRKTRQRKPKLIH